MTARPWPAASVSKDDLHEDKKLFSVKMMPVA
jgi:hypothetical protein